MAAQQISPPYPGDLEAKGWALDFDLERIEQSDTWAIATAEQRPWLLMLWLVSWKQVPVASYPNSDRLIAARIGMPLEMFEAWRDILLSGWELATDGRLYHKTLTSVVHKMAEKRSKDRERVRKWRAARDAQHPPTDDGDQPSDADDQASDDGVTRDKRVSTTPPPTPIPTLPISEEPSGSSEPSASLTERGREGSPTGEPPPAPAPPPLQPRAERRCRMPPSFSPNETGLRLAAERGLDVAKELQRFADWHAARGSLMADWQAAWRTWVGKARPERRAQPPPGSLLSASGEQTARNASIAKSMLFAETNPS